jgi:hypothetical protein
MAAATEIRTIVVPEYSSGWGESSLPAPVEQLPREITPEIVAVIQAAAKEFFGREVRVVSIRILPASNADSGAWLQRGLDTIQGSHNLVQQRH